MSQRSQDEAKKLWKAGKVTHCTFPDRIKCEKCNIEHNFDSCKDLRLHDANTKKLELAMSVECPTEECKARLYFIAPYFKKQKKPKVR